MLTMQEAQVQSLVRELRSHMSCGSDKKKVKKNLFPTKIEIKCLNFHANWKRSHFAESKSN